MTAPDAAGIEAALAAAFDAGWWLAIDQPNISRTDFNKCRAAHVAAALLPVVTQAQAEALRAAADGVRHVREHGLPDGVDSHPTAEHFEDWLRARADESGA